MQNREQISAGQLSVIFFCYMTGSSIINIPGPLINYAKNGAWISLMISLLVSLLILVCMLVLFRKFPELTFIDYSKQTVGKWVTVILAIPFLSFQFHMTSGIVLDIGLFMTSSMMRQTPLYIFLFAVFLVVALTVRSGIETMARMFTFPIVLVVCFTILILVLNWENYNIEHLQPIMPDGIEPVILGAYFSYGFPYVEIVLMAMILPYVRPEDRKKLKRVLPFALLLNAFLLLSVTLATILVFGPMAGERNYSMFEVARIVDLLEVIQRIESIMGISLILSSFMKASITMFILNLTFTRLFNLQDDRILVFPIALTCFMFSMQNIEKGTTRWINAVSVIHPLWATFAYLVPLLVVAAVAAIRKKPSLNS